jgi:hypothetical protein
MGRQIEATHEALRKMVLDLENLDATIEQFDPNYQVEAIRPKAFRPLREATQRGQDRPATSRLTPGEPRGRLGAFPT